MKFNANVHSDHDLKTKDFNKSSDEPDFSNILKALSSFFSTIC